MTLKIQHKRSAVKAKAPQPTDLEYGEIAVNYETSDPCIYIKDSANTIRRIGSQPGVLVFKGAVAPTSTAPAAPDIGNVYIMNAAGVMAASWTGMAGKTVAQNENIAWSGTQWESLGAGTSVWTRGGGGLIPTTAADNVFIGGTASAPKISLNADGSANFTGGVTQTERTITTAFDLATGNFWTCGAIAIPNPTNAVAGMSGLIRLTAAPTGWGGNFSTAPTPTVFPCIVPFYVESATKIRLGAAVVVA